MKTIKQTCGSLLIELLLVCAVVAIVMTLSVSHSNSIKRLAVRAEIEKMRSLFWYLQQRAVTINKEIILTFDVAKQSYRFDTIIEKFSSGVQFGVLHNLKGPPSDPKTIVHSPVTFDQQKVIFRPDGTISSGTVYLHMPANSTVYALTAPVSDISYLRIYCYDYEWKLIS
jgi:Tfp pilus assembly protein FimT